MKGSSSNSSARWGISTTITILLSLFALAMLKAGASERFAISILFILSAILCFTGIGVRKGDGASGKIGFYSLIFSLLFFSIPHIFILHSLITYFSAALGFLCLLYWVAFVLLGPFNGKVLR